MFGKFLISWLMPLHCDHWLYKKVAADKDQFVFKPNLYSIANYRHWHCLYAFATAEQPLQADHRIDWLYKKIY